MRLAAMRRTMPSIETAADLDDAIASVDAVVVATPPRTHASIALELIRAGKHVLVEKPLATTAAEDAESLIDAAQDAGVVLMVGHTFEYNAAVWMLRELVQSQELGRAVLPRQRAAEHGAVPERVTSSSTWRRTTSRSPTTCSARRPLGAGLGLAPRGPASRGRRVPATGLRRARRTGEHPRELARPLQGPPDHRGRASKRWPSTTTCRPTNASGCTTRVSCGGEAGPGLSPIPMSYHYGAITSPVVCVRGAARRCRPGSSSCVARPPAADDGGERARGRPGPRRPGRSLPRDAGSHRRGAGPVTISAGAGKLPVECRRAARRRVPFNDLAAMAGGGRRSSSTRRRRAAVDGSASSAAPPWSRSRTAWARTAAPHHAVGVANGTDALELDPAGARRRPGDEVIVPANTFIATAAAVVRAGAVPASSTSSPETLLITRTTVDGGADPRTAPSWSSTSTGNVADMDGRRP